MVTKKGKLIYRPNAGEYRINLIDCVQQGKRLITILFDILDIDKAEYFSNQEQYAYNLVSKFLSHASTIFLLIKLETEKNKPNLPVEVSFLASVDILVRASFEAYLTFYHLFIDSQEVEEKEFRYFRYVYSGYLERTNIYKNDLVYSKHENIIENDRRTAGRLYQSLIKNNSFRKLSPKERRTILDGKWRLGDWTDIAFKAGFSDKISIFVYKYLCGYAHSASLSVRQLKTILALGQQYNSIDSLIVLLNICMAKMIQAYVKVFPSTLVYFNDLESIEFINLWSKQANPNDSSSNESPEKLSLETSI
jgi:hypothetical protein